MRRTSPGIVLALAALVLAACAGGRDSPIAKRIYALDAELKPTTEAFILCAGHGCRDRHVVRLTPGEWARVRAHFSPAPGTPGAEREAMRHAIATLERLSGDKTGTSADRAGTYSSMFAANQLDCADETVNVTTYLRLMIADGLVRHHRLGSRVHKGAIFDYLPHMAPTVVDRETGIAWVMDSWYLDHGALPETVTVATWREPYETWGSTGEPARP